MAKTDESAPGAATPPPAKEKKPWSAPLQKWVRAMAEALKQLGNRKCPNLNNDLRVSRLLIWLRPHIDAIEIARQKVQKDAADRSKEPGLSASALEMIVLQMQTSLNELELTPFPIYDRPPFKLGKGDLPRDMTGEGGWKNSSSLGAIVADLGELLELSGAELDELSKIGA